MAASMHLNYGLGIIHLQEIDMGGGRIISPSSHHVTGWLAKHGRRKTPGCHFARGWVAGVLAVISRILGKHHVSISDCVQKERSIGNVVPLIMLTHEAHERDVRNSIRIIDRLKVVRGKSQVIRIEESQRG